MTGTILANAKETMECVLQSLPAGSRFQVISFGSKYEKLFEGCTSVEYSQENLEFAINKIREMRANMGGTDILPPLMEALENPISTNGLPRQAFVFTDGQVGNTREVVNRVRRACDKFGSRVFSFGIGSQVSVGLVRGIAHAGRGSYEFVSGDGDMNDVVMRQLRIAVRPILSNVRVDWGNLFVFGETAPNPTPDIFHGVRFFASIFATELNPTTVQLIGTSPDGREKIWSIDVTLEMIENSESTNESRSLFHAIVARARIKDLEKRMEQTTDDDEKMVIQRELVRISETWQVLSKSTALIGIEKRENPSFSAPVPRIIPSDWMNPKFQPKKLSNRLAESDFSPPYIIVLHV